MLVCECLFVCEFVCRESVCSSVSFFVCTSHCLLVSVCLYVSFFIGSLFVSLGVFLCNGYFLDLILSRVVLRYIRTLDLSSSFLIT